MKRLYVLARRDLPGSQPFVQAGHAAIAWCHNESCRWHWDGREVTTPRWRWNNENLIYLGVRDEQELLEWFCRLRQDSPLGKVTEGAVAFHEPYFNNQMTAFACMGERETFEGLTLL